MNISDIHESLVNGQRRQMVEQIREYGPADFFSDYKKYIYEIGANIGFFTDATISYFRILER